MKHLLITSVIALAACSQQEPIQPPIIQQQPQVVQQQPPVVVQQPPVVVQQSNADPLLYMGMGALMGHALSGGGGGGVSRNTTIVNKTIVNKTVNISKPAPSRPSTPTRRR